ncbi:MAG: response regulator transcription factor [Dehalococcoidia bacterium]|nr:response regulator transcription factor [Dehalococcoidia bacterium]
MARVLIADDHSVVRQGLKQILADTNDMEVVAEAANGAEVLERLRVIGVDIVVLDLSMPGISGLEVIRQIRKEYPKIAVLVLSVHSEEQYAVRVMKVGASGYVTKDSAPEELVKALRCASCGRKYVSGSLAERLAIDLERGSDKPPHEDLSDREYEVFRLIVSGLSAQQIAGELGLSAKTVSTYRARLMLKMRMHSSAELTRYAIVHGIVD